MEFGFEVVAAKRPVLDAPAQQPMRPAKLARNPDTDTKKVRRQQARQRKTAYGPYGTSGVDDTGTGYDDISYHEDAETCANCGEYIVPNVNGEWVHKDLYHWCHGDRNSTEAVPEGHEAVLKTASPPKVQCPACNGSMKLIQGGSYLCGQCGRMIPHNQVRYDTDLQRLRAGSSRGAAMAPFRRFAADDDDDDDDKDSPQGEDQPWYDRAESGGGGDGDDSSDSDEDEDDSDEDKGDSDDEGGHGFTSPKREAQLLQAMAKASLPEQRALALELDTLRKARRHRRQAARDIDLADAHIRDCLTPVTTHALNTTATDWLGEITESDFDTVSDMDMQNEVVAQATLWFRRASADVKADRDEFGQQALGMARRTAGVYGERAHVARRAFLDHVAHLHRVAGSGSELTADPSGQGHSGLPDEVPLGGNEDTFDEDFWSEDSAAVPSTRAPNIRENATRRQAGEVPEHLKEHLFKKKDGGGGDDDGDDKPDWLKDKIEGAKTAGGWRTCGKCGAATPRDTPACQSCGAVQKGAGETSTSGGSENRNQPKHWNASTHTAETAAEGWPLDDTGEPQNPNVEDWFEDNPTTGDSQDLGELPGVKSRRVTSAYGSPDDVIAAYPYQEGVAAGEGFYEGDGDDLLEELYSAGWKSVAYQAPYYWCMKAPNGKLLSYVEGDLYRGNKLTRQSSQHVAVRELNQISDEIVRDWGSKIHFAARPYVEAMRYLGDINTMYGADSAKQIVSYFLSNASSWRGETAKRVKQELKDMLAGKTSARTAAPSKADPSGQGVSGLPQVNETGGKDDRPMWPWELPDEDDPDTGGGAADVANVRTPGGEAGYPQPSSRSKSSRRVVAEDDGGGQTCSVCGDAIERDPAGEDNRTWHHSNGETHDHEATPGGGSKESRRKQADYGGNWYVYDEDENVVDGPFPTRAEAEAAMEPGESVGMGDEFGAYMGDEFGNKQGAARKRQLAFRDRVQASMNGGR